MLIFLITIAFLFSAFFSMSEIVYTVADRIKIRVWAKEGSASAKKTKKLIKNPDGFLIPILVGNNIANVAYATFFAYLASSFNWKSSNLQIAFYETVILVIFAEMIPKVMGKKFSEKIAVKIIYPFVFIKTLLAPISYLVGIISVRIMKMIKMESGKSGWVLISKGDIGYIVDQAVRSETVKLKDAQIIRKVLGLEQMKVREIMLHRRSIIAVDINSPLYKLRKTVILTSFSKIIVYENDLDNIAGVAFVKDILKEDIKEIKDVLRPALFVPENTSILSLFKMFKKERSSIGVVIDEFGGCLGLVTMHDILELIVGKVDDPHDNAESDRGIIYRPEIKTLIIAGTADPEELYRMIGSITGKDMRKPKFRNETVNGYVINSIKRIPEQGETVALDGLEYRIMKARKNFIETLIIKLPKEGG